jgi:hypothetical protein
MRWHWREGAMIARAVIGSGEMQNRYTGVSPPRRRATAPETSLVPQTKRGVLGA